MTDPIRVLVVDDDFRVADLHRGIVDARPGFLALPPAHSVAAARRALRTDAPGLLLADGFLPDGDGIDLIRSADVDAFLLSAASDAASVRRALRAGALGCLLKPFDARMLADLLDRYARYRNLVSGDRPLDQSQLDRALAILHPSAASATVSRSATEELLLDALGGTESSAAEIAEATGVSRATAQRHLTALATRGLVEVRLRYGTTGRPEHRYVATAR